MIFQLGFVATREYIDSYLPHSGKSNIKTQNINANCLKLTHIYQLSSLYLIFTEKNT